MIDRSTGESGKIGLFLGYIPRPTDPFPALIIAGMLSRLHDYEKDLVIFSDAHRPIDEILYEEIKQGRVEGLVFLPNDPALVTRLSEPGLPVVAIADRVPGIVSVVVDDDVGAYLLVEHLSVRGYRQILYRRDFYAHESAIRRYQAFEKSARYLGMEVIDTLPADSSGSLSPTEEAYLLAPKGQRPDAVVSWFDMYAYPVLKFCRAHGLHVPHDIAVAGFDGAPPSPIEPARRLTTIMAPWLQVAEVAVDRLIEMGRGSQTVLETVLPVNLVIGDTT